MARSAITLLRANSMVSFPTIRASTRSFCIMGNAARTSSRFRTSTLSGSSSFCAAQLANEFVGVDAPAQATVDVRYRVRSGLARHQLSAFGAKLERGARPDAELLAQRFRNRDLPALGNDGFHLHSSVKEYGRC